MATKKSADTVTIACKLPNGLSIPIPGRAQHIKLHGSTSAFAIGNHGMTRGIAASDWETIKTVYKDAAFIKNEAIFAFAEPEDASAKAIERQDVKSGFEPINPDDPHMMRRFGLDLDKS